MEQSPKTKGNISKIERKTRSWIRLAIILIILLCLILFMPFILLFTHLVTIPFGEPAAYIATSIVGNLYSPIITLFILVSIFIVAKFLLFNVLLQKMMISDTMDKPKIPKLQVRKLLAVLFLTGVFLVISFRGFKNIYSLVLDIGNLKNADYATMNGTLSIYEMKRGDMSEYRMKIDDVKFSGGYVNGEEPTEGDIYHVEYLPHTMYVVSYVRIE